MKAHRPRQLKSRKVGSLIQHPQPLLFFGSTGRSSRIKINTGVGGSWNVGLLAGFVLDTHRLEERVSTAAFTLAGRHSHQVVFHIVQDKLRSWMRLIFTSGMGRYRRQYACRSGTTSSVSTTPWRRSRSLGRC
jgi:hypothetical protein